MLKKQRTQWDKGGAYVGLQYCESCSNVTNNGDIKAVDLRDYPQPVIAEHLWRSLDFATGLIDPRPEKRSSAMARVPKPFEASPRDAIFELVMTLARNLAPDTKRTLGPEDVAIACEAVVGWPDGFETYVKEWTGRKQAAHNLASQSNVNFLTREDHSQISQVIVDSMRLKLRHGAKVRGPGYSARHVTHFVEIATRFHDQTADLKFVLEVPGFRDVLEAGLPRVVAADLLFKLVAGPHENNHRSASHWCAHMLWRLKALRAKPRRCQDNQVRLDRAVAAVWHRSGNPWSEIFDRLGDGTLQSWRGDNCTDIIRRTYVDVRDLHAVLSGIDAPAWRFNNLPLTNPEIRILAGFDFPTIAMLRTQRWMPGEVSLEDLLEIKRNCILVSEVASRGIAGCLGFNSRWVCRTLTSLGIEPMIAEGARYIWKRDEVEQQLLSRVIPRIT